MKPESHFSGWGRQRISRGWVPAVAAMIAFLPFSAVALAAPSAADVAMIAKVNETAGPAAGTKDSAAELGPAIVAMQPAPAALTSVYAAAFLAHGAAGWPEAEKWATAEPQQAALKVLATVADLKSKYSFGLKYGSTGVDPAWVKAGFWTDLSQPETLAAADFLYLDQLDALGKLVMVEVTRLAHAGEGKAVTDLLGSWIRFTRQIADREFFAEKRWAFLAIMAAGERLRDVLYTHEASFKSPELVEAIKTIEERILLLARIKFPEGDRAGAEQLVVRTITERGGPSPDAFAATMARLSSRDRPLRLFGEAAHWGGVEASHAGWFDTKDEIAKVFGDWTKRWELDNPFDLLLRQPTDFSRMDSARFALLDRLLAPLDGFDRLRQELYLELRGTRMAMAVIAWKIAQKNLPPNIKAVEPAYIKDNELDTYNYDPRKRITQVFRFWVPMRDQTWGPRDTPVPYQVKVIPPAEGARSGSDLDLKGIEGEFATAELFGIPVLPLFGPDVFDAKSGTLDVPKLREAIKEESSRIPFRPNHIEQLQKLLKEVADSGVDISKQSETYKKQLSRLLEVEFANDYADETVAGLTKAEWSQYIAGIAVGLFASPGFTDAVKKVSNRRSLTTDDARAIHDAIINAATKEDLAQAFLKKALPYMMPLTAGAGEPFSKAVDDTQFLLYSVGIDGVDDRARLVGHNGRDLLIWPPILSLVRENLAPAK